MERYVTPKIGGDCYGIESDDLVSIRVFMRNSENDSHCPIEDWIGLRITQGLKVVIERWNDGRDDSEPDREYIVNDDEEEKKVQKVICDGRALVLKIKQLQSDEREANLVGVDLDDLDYDVMKLVGQVFVDLGKGPVPEVVEEALKL